MEFRLFTYSRLTCIWQTFFRTSATQNSWSSLHIVVKIFSQTSPNGSKQTLQRFSSKVPSTMCFTTPLMSTTVAMACTNPPEDEKYFKTHSHFYIFDTKTNSKRSAILPPKSNYWCVLIKIDAIQTRILQPYWIFWTLLVYDNVKCKIFVSAICCSVVLKSNR